DLDEMAHERHGVDPAAEAAHGQQFGEPIPMTGQVWGQMGERLIEQWDKARQEVWADSAPDKESAPGLCCDTDVDVPIEERDDVLLRPPRMQVVQEVQLTAGDDPGELPRRRRHRDRIAQPRREWIG